MHENYYQNQDKRVFNWYRYEENQEMNNSMLFYPNNYSNFSHDKNKQYRPDEGRNREYPPDIYN